VLSLINIQVRGVAAPNFIICLAFGYGGFVQLLAGMWYVLNLCFGDCYYSMLSDSHLTSPLPFM
jgi:succinate-acetate transporter protein